MELLHVRLEINPNFDEDSLNAPEKGCAFS